MKCIGILRLAHCVLRGHFEHAQCGLYGSIKFMANKTEAVVLEDSLAIPTESWQAGKQRSA